MPNNQLHVHYRQSSFDGTCEYKDAVKRVKELGGTALSITDHGVATGILPFIQACIDGGVKPIVGVEGYRQEDDVLSFKSHEVFYAMDRIGYIKGISKAITMSNKRIDSKGAPRMDRNILTKCFGPGTAAHGHVITTTACMQGVCNSIILANKKIDDKIKRVEAKRDKFLYPGDPECEKLEVELNGLVEKINSLREEKSSVNKIAKKSVKKLETAYNAAIGTPDEADRKKVYDDALAEIEVAKEEVTKLDAEITAASKKKKEVNDKIKSMHDSMDKWISYDEEIETLAEGKMSEEEIKSAVIDEYNFLIETFGKENVYTEVQYHGIADEAYCMPILVGISRELNIPLVAANDAHMVYGTPEERRKRQILRSLRFNKWEKEFDGDKELYFKTDEQLSEMLSQILDEDAVKEAIANVDVIVDRCNYVPEKEEHYPKFKSSIEGETANDAIRRICRENISWRFPNPDDWTEEYEKRLEYELGIICKMGYADYHLIVQDFLGFGRRLGHLSDEDLEYLTNNISDMTLDEVNDFVNTHQTEVGLTIGPGRGSAVGSLVCYLLGITSINPLKYDLLFERFLNPERISMPKQYIGRSM